VPLSEHEQRLLEQIEAALYAEDPKFAHTYRGTDLRSLLRRRLLRCAVLFLLGAGALAAGLVLPLLPLLAGGAAGMLAAAALAVVFWTRHPRPTRARLAPVGSTRQVRSPSARRPSIIARLDERWQRRMEQRGR
jgi:hypothetical protein